MHPSEYRIMRECEDRHWWYVGLHELARGTLSDLDYGRNDRMLDAGCGTGGWMHKCRDIFPVTIGLEPSACAIQELESRGLRNLVRGDILRIPFPDDDFDCVVSFDVLSIFGSEGSNPGFDELVRVVRPGGHLLLQVPAYKWMLSEHDERVGNSTRFTCHEVADRLVERGMHIDYAGYRMTFLFPIAATLRMIKRLFRPPEQAIVSDLRLPHPFANAVLANIVRFENALIRRGCRLPFGLSVFVLASKPRIDSKPEKTSERNPHFMANSHEIRN